MPVPEAIHDRIVDTLADNGAGMGLTVAGKAMLCERLAVAIEQALDMEQVGWISPHGNVTILREIESTWVEDFPGDQALCRIATGQMS